MCVPKTRNASASQLTTWPRRPFRLTLNRRNNPSKRCVMRTATIKLALLTLGLLISVQAQTQRNSRSVSANAGSVCIAPVPRPTSGEKSLYNPTGGNSISVYSVRIDDRLPVVTSDSSPLKISGLAPRRKHLVKIIGDGELKESFRFKFSSYSSNKLCLWFKPLYETWTLWEAKNSGAECQCK